MTAATRARKGGSSSTSRSTTTAVSPTPRSSATRKQRPQSASFAVQSPSTAATASRLNECSQTTEPPTSRSRTRSRVAVSGSGIYAPARTGRKQTGRPSASSARCSPAGPMAPSTAQATNAPPPLTAGSGTTTIADDTQLSATKPRSAEPTCSGPTPSRVARYDLSFTAWRIICAATARVNCGTSLSNTERTVGPRTDTAPLVLLPGGDRLLGSDRYRTCSPGQPLRGRPV